MVLVETEMGLERFCRRKMIALNRGGNLGFNTKQRWLREKSFEKHLRQER